VHVQLYMTGFILIVIVIVNSRLSTVSTKAKSREPAYSQAPTLCRLDETLDEIVENEYTSQSSDESFAENINFSLITNMLKVRNTKALQCILLCRIAPYMCSCS